MNRKWLWCYLLLVFIYRAPILSAQPSSTIPPNRKAAVAQILARCPEAQAANTDAKRRRVIPFIVSGLNAIDGPGAWGLLYRMDREDEDPMPGRLTADVVVWTRTKEHFDVLSGGDVPTALWLAHGVITNPRWEIRSPNGFPTVCNGGVVDPEPQPEPQPPPVDAELLKRIAAIDQELSFHRSRLATLEQTNAEQVVTIQALRDVIATLTLDLTHTQERLVQIERRPPMQYLCSGRIAFGIPVSCKVVPEVNP